MEFRKPTIVVPFSENCASTVCQDIFIYLRPDTNGIRVESAIMRGVTSTEELRKHIELAYLANLPGDFLIRKGVVRDHYKTRILFAYYGKEIFTPYMKKEFSRFFGVRLQDVPVFGAYKALEVMGIPADELFNLWVSKKDLLRINGQTIKKMGNIYVVNNDIPAILDKNNNRTDIAVMIFRTDYFGEDFYNVILRMTDILIEEGILDSRSKFSHVFHYSKGPFEQILDAVGFLYDEEGNHLPLEKIRFYRYLKKRGYDRKKIEHTLKDPIFQFSFDGKFVEDSIFNRTKNLGYSDSLEIMNSARAQVFLDIYDIPYSEQREIK